MTEQLIRQATVTWLERAVIGLNLCPFAKAVHVRDQIRFAVCDATDTSGLLDALRAEIRLLLNTPEEQIATTLLIHPAVLNDFLDFNDFLGEADDVLAELDGVGILQIASFHPDYQFAGSAPDDVDNFTNRAPYPTLHLIREASIERVLASYPDPDDIYERNIATLRRIGPDGWRKLFL